MKESSPVPVAARRTAAPTILLAFFEAVIVAVILVAIGHANGCVQSAPSLPAQRAVIDDPGTDQARCETILAMVCGIGHVCYEIDPRECLAGFDIPCASVVVESAAFSRCAVDLDGYRCREPMPETCKHVMTDREARPAPSPSSPDVHYDI